MRKYVSRRLLALSEGEVAALTASMRQIGVGTQGGALRLSPYFIGSSMTSGSQGHSMNRWPESKSTRKTALG